MSIREAVDASGVSAGTISKAERGITGFSPASLHAYAAVLGLRVGWALMPLDGKDGAK